MTTLPAFYLQAPFGGGLIFWCLEEKAFNLSFCSDSKKISAPESHIDIKNALSDYFYNQKPIAAELGKKMLSARNDLSIFQKKILLALLDVPFAKTISYQDLAISAGLKPSAARAVGNACNKNPFPIFIPCHRVIPKNGTTGNFAWGEKTKAWLLTQEQAACSTPLLKIINSL